MVELARRLTHHRWFSRLVLGLILASAALVAAETSASLVRRAGPILELLQGLVLAAFVAELGLRLLASARQPRAFLRDGWNLFDLTVVLASLLPSVGPLATVARLARVLRVARLVSASRELRLIVGTMLRSIPSLGHVALLLALLLFIYAVLGVHWFRDTDPSRFGGLGPALLTLFQVLTLEGWVEVQRGVAAAHPLSWLYFASFILVAVFVVVNLFIAVVLNNLEEVRAELARDAEERAPAASRPAPFSRAAATSGWRPLQHPARSALPGGRREDGAGRRRGGADEALPVSHRQRGGGG